MPDKLQEFLNYCNEQGISLNESNKRFLNNYFKPMEDTADDEKEVE